jgi:cytochrome c oxidase cbb3-type subunit III
MCAEMKSAIAMLTLILMCISTRGETPQSSSRSQKSPLALNPSAIQAGRKRFVQNCGACHGSSATGGRAPKLADSPRVHEMPDKRIFNIIQNGVPGTAMPSNRLPDQQIWEIVLFIRSLNAVANDQFVPGDPASGKALFFGTAECAKCHSIAGQGGSSGPDLSSVASRQSAESIRQAIVAPSQFIEPGFAVVVVVNASGERLEGIVKNESAYSMQLQDLGGDFHSISKSDVSDIIRRPESMMPAATLSRQQLQNILAFLSRQKGASDSGN